MQNGKNSIVKHALVHELRKQFKKKGFLPNKFHAASYKLSSEAFWSDLGIKIVEMNGDREDLQEFTKNYKFNMEITKNRRLSWYKDFNRYTSSK